MAQLNFGINNFFSPARNVTISQATASFVPFNFFDSVSFNTLNIGMRYNSNSDSNFSLTVSIGLYSLTGASLSIANSITRSFTQTTTNAVRLEFLSFSGVSANQNITPGTWFFCLLFSMSNVTDHTILGYTSINPQNAFPGAFIGGRMTDSTAALPASIATTALDTTGVDAMTNGFIIISA